MIFLRCLFFLIFLLPTYLSAAEIHNLFPESSKIANYWVDEETYWVKTFIVGGSPVSSGDTIVLDTGESFIFEKILGFNSNSYILQTKSGEAVRLPQELDERSLQIFRGTASSFNALSQIVDKKFLVQVSPDNFRSNFALKVERLELSSLLGEFIFWFESDIESEEYKHLVDFFWAFRNVAESDDTYFQQIGYVKGRSWVLFDYSMKMKINDQSPADVEQFHFLKEVFASEWTSLKASKNQADFSVSSPA